jgi:hypothetical protein
MLTQELDKLRCSLLKQVDYSFTRLIAARHKHEFTRFTTDEGGVVKVFVFGYNAHGYRK